MQPNTQQHTQKTNDNNINENYHEPSSNSQQTKQNQIYDSQQVAILLLLCGYLVIDPGLPLDDEFKRFGLLREHSNELGPWKNIPENYTIADLEHNIMDIDGEE